MKNFEDDIKIAITKLKQLHKKNSVSAKKMTLIELDHLQLHHKDLRKDDPLTLYNKAQIILEAIQEHLDETPIENQERGLEEYSFYLQEVIHQYHKYENHILHKDRYAASILLDAIQICTVPNHARNEAIAKSLKEKTEILCEIGSNQVLHQLMTTFKNYAKEDEFFFIMQMHHFRKMLKKKGRRIKKPTKVSQH